MAILSSDGTTVLSKSGLYALTTDVPVTQCTVNSDVYQSYNYPPIEYQGNYKNFDGERRLLFKAGQVVNKADIEALFPVATIASISPATGAAAGGTPVTIKGTNLDGATAAALGGVALTSFVVVNNTTITGVSGAHSAATVNVTVTDDSGTLTLTNGYVYV
jgi:hypothetical protein